MLYVIGASTTRSDEAARARVAPSMAFDADSANNREPFAVARAAVSRSLSIFNAPRGLRRRLGRESGGGAHVRVGSLSRAGHNF